MKRVTVALTALALLAPAAAPARAQHEGHHATPNPVKEDYKFVFGATEKKLKDLAAAFSEEQYAWRPAEGVRSVGEVVQHVAWAAYLLPGMLGIEAPEGAPSGFEAAIAYEKAHATKTDAVADLDKAFAHLHHVIESVTPEQLAAEVDFFGNKVTGRTMMLILLDHNAEHLGQLIAYARSNGVVPPWSAGGDS